MRQPAAFGTLRKPRQLKQQYGGQSRGSQTQSLAAPVGGWNVRDPIANMDPLDAVIMDNWFPGTGSVEVRKGWADHVTGIGDQVETLMPYNEIDGTQTLFAIAGGAIYDVTTPGAVGAAAVSGLSNSRWQHVNFTNTSAISYLCAFNGVDAPRYYNGTTWITITAVSAPAITGVTATTLDSPWIFKRRMWMVKADSLSAWYLPVDAVGGAATEFSLYGLFKKGGYLVAGATWTVDGGEGLDDYIVFITSEGEVAVYRGTNPGSDFTVQGVWDLADPIGKKCFLKYGGDLLIINKMGVYPLARALQSAKTDRESAITNKIEGEVTKSAALYKDNFGWQLIHDEENNALMLNVPVSEGSSQVQYCMNTITGAWCRFTGIESNCWDRLGGDVYFGGDGFVGLYGEALNDNGENIVADVQPAYSYFGDRGSLKKFQMVRPIISSNGSPTLLAAMNVDYSLDIPSAPLNFTPSAAGVWDTGLWDAALWGGDLSVLRDWQTVNAIGTSGALRLMCAVNGLEVRFEATDYLYEVGGVI